MNHAIVVLEDCCIYLAITVLNLKWKLGNRVKILPNEVDCFVYYFIIHINIVDR